MSVNAIIMCMHMGYSLFASKSSRVQQKKTAFLHLLRKPIQGKFHFDHERTQYSTEIKNYNATEGKYMYIVHSYLNNNEEKHEYRFNINKTCWIKETAIRMSMNAQHDKETKSLHVNATSSFY